MYPWLAWTSITQADFKLRDLPTSLPSAGIKGSRTCCLFTRGRVSDILDLNSRFSCFHPPLLRFQVCTITPSGVCNDSPEKGCVRVGAEPSNLLITGVSSRLLKSMATTFQCLIYSY